MERTKRPLSERFWEKVDIKGPDDCWLWKASFARYGYGQFMLKRNKLKKSHRLAWELSIGPVPDGFSLLHKCDTPACCNPRHLFLGTQIDNMRDCKQKGRIGFLSQPGEINGNHKYTAAQIEKVYLLLEKKVKGSEISQLTGVSQGVVSLIKHHKTWRHITEVK